MSVNEDGNVIELRDFDAEHVVLRRDDILPPYTSTSRTTLPAKSVKRKSRPP